MPLFQAISGGMGETSQPPGDDHERQQPSSRSLGAAIDDTGPHDDEPILIEEREPESKDDRGVRNTSLVTAFRDFFLAAFSDNYSYQDAYCCGADTTICSVPMGTTGRGIADQHDGIRTQNSSASFHDLEPSASRDSSRKRRKKPLAIAVGFNYAEDMNGRPVVITRGSRKLPSDLPRSSSRNSRQARKHSPASVRTNETPPSVTQPQPVAV